MLVTATKIKNELNLWDLIWGGFMRSPLWPSAGMAPWVQLGAGVHLFLSSESWSSAQVWRSGLWPVSALRFPILSHTLKVLKKFWPQMFNSNNELRLPLTPLFYSMSTKGFEDGWRHTCLTGMRGFWTKVYTSEREVRCQGENIQRTYSNVPLP